MSGSGVEFIVDDGSLAPGDSASDSRSKGGSMGGATTLTIVSYIGALALLLVLLALSCCWCVNARAKGKWAPWSKHSNGGPLTLTKSEQKQDEVAEGARFDFYNGLHGVHRGNGGNVARLSQLQQLAQRGAYPGIHNGTVDSWATKEPAPSDGYCSDRHLRDLDGHLVSDLVEPAFHEPRGFNQFMSSVHKQGPSRPGSRVTGFNQVERSRGSVGCGSPSIAAQMDLDVTFDRITSSMTKSPRPPSSQSEKTYDSLVSSNAPDEATTAVPQEPDPDGPVYHMAQRASDNSNVGGKPSDTSDGGESVSKGDNDEDDESNFSNLQSPPLSRTSAPRHVSFSNGSYTPTSIKPGRTAFEQAQLDAAATAVHATMVRSPKEGVRAPDDM
jgi:hypothetical protein